MDGFGFMKPGEAADYLKVSTRTLEEWRRNRTGPKFHKVGQWVRYRKEDLDVYGAPSAQESGAEQ